MNVFLMFHFFFINSFYFKLYVILVVRTTVHVCHLKFVYVRMVSLAKGVKEVT